MPEVLRSEGEEAIGEARFNVVCAGARSQSALEKDLPLDSADKGAFLAPWFQAFSGISSLGIGRGEFWGLWEPITGR